MSKSKILAALTSLSHDLSSKIDAIFVRKEEGKGLSSNDFTNEEKSNLSSSVAHTGDAVVHITSEERTKWNESNNKKHEHQNKTILDNTTASYEIAEKEKLSGIAAGAEVNQNAFGSFVVGSTTLAAGSKEDNLTLAAGKNISLTPDVANKKLTISGTTPTNASLGQGYGVCTTAADTTAKIVTLENYNLVVGGMITVEFTHDVPANSTMNINGKGAKPIHYRRTAIIDGVIREGDIALFVYNGSNYILLAVDAAIDTLLYVEATNEDIDAIISESYVSDGEEDYSDIDAIIAGTFTED